MVGASGPRSDSTVPAFIGELKSLEVLDLNFNDEQIYATLEFLIEGCPRLREVRLMKWPNTEPGTPESLTHLRAFKTSLLERNLNAVVIYR